MTNDQDNHIRTQLRSWLRNADKKSAKEITDSTPLLEQGIINSLQLMDLILFIEQLRDEPIDVSELKPGAFKDVNTICTAFFEGVAA